MIAYCIRLLYVMWHILLFNNGIRCWYIGIYQIYIGIIFSIQLKKYFSILWVIWRHLHILLEEIWAHRLMTTISTDSDTPSLTPSHRNSPQDRVHIDFLDGHLIPRRDAAFRHGREGATIEPQQWPPCEMPLWGWRWRLLVNLFWSRHFQES